MQGYIKLFRKICENEFYFSQKFTKMQAWYDLWLLATHTKRTVFIVGNLFTVGSENSSACTIIRAVIGFPSLSLLATLSVVISPIASPVFTSNKSDFSNMPDDVNSMRPKVGSKASRTPLEPS